MKTKCITITDEQEKFIKNQSKDFKLSWVVQNTLKKYMEEQEQWQKEN